MTTSMRVAPARRTQTNHTQRDGGQLEQDHSVWSHQGNPRLSAVNQPLCGEQCEQAPPKRERDVGNPPSQFLNCPLVRPEEVGDPVFRRRADTDGHQAILLSDPSDQSGCGRHGGGLFGVGLGGLRPVGWPGSWVAHEGHDPVSRCADHNWTKTPSAPHPPPLVCFSNARFPNARCRTESSSVALASRLGRVQSSFSVWMPLT